MTKQNERVQIDRQSARKSEKEAERERETEIEDEKDRKGQRDRQRQTKRQAERHRDREREKQCICYLPITTRFLGMKPSCPLSKCLTNHHPTLSLQRKDKLGVSAIDVNSSTALALAVPGESSKCIMVKIGGSKKRKLSQKT